MQQEPAIQVGFAVTAMPLTLRVVGSAESYHAYVHETDADGIEIAPQGLSRLMGKLAASGACQQRAAEDAARRDDNSDLLSNDGTDVGNTARDLALALSAPRAILDAGIAGNRMPVGQELAIHLMTFM